ncbi:MAG: BLUF domain-containing protein [Pseudomonadota bacterium]
MTSDLLRITYFSRNALDLCDDRMRFEIDAILEVSQARNAACGVGGALMFNRGVFVQTLEGPLQAVEDTFNRVQADPRHDEVTVLEVTPIEASAFQAWSMGFVGEEAQSADLYAGIASDSGFEAAAATLPDIYAMMQRLALRNELRLRAA